MPVDFLQEQEGRDADGRFMKRHSGNPDGRPPGTRNKATEAAELLLNGEVEALTRRAVELALDGQIGALRLCLDRAAVTAASQRSFGGTAPHGCRECRRRLIAAVPSAY